MTWPANTMDLNYRFKKIYSAVNRLIANKTQNFFSLIAGYSGFKESTVNNLD